MAKNENEKHDHKWTKLLKVVIFACMMLAPLFAIGVKCAYVTFNKNAYLSYGGININKKQINDIEQIDYTTMYYFDSKIVNENPNTTGNQMWFRYQIVDNENYTNTTNIDIQSSNLVYINNNNNYGIAYNNTTILGNINTNQRVTFNFYLTTLVNDNQTTIDYFKTIFKTIGTPREYTLDNTFYYAVDQMKDNELFNWTQNTAIYNGVNAVTTGLGITTEAIPILLVYWILLTLIYVIFDIVIETFTWLTHLFSNKVIK